MAILGSPDLITFVLEQLLRLPDALINQYTGVENQLLYLVLLPHVLILIFLVLFVQSFPHRGLGIVVGIVAYIYMIFNGWYAALVPILNAWFNIILLLGIGTYLLMFIVHPFRSKDIATLAGGAGKAVMSATIVKARERENLRKELELINKQIRVIRPQVTLVGQGGAVAQMQLNQLQMDKKRIEHEIKKLGG